MFSATLLFTKICSKKILNSGCRKNLPNICEESFKAFQKYALESGHTITAENIAMRSSNPQEFLFLSNLFTANLTKGNSPYQNRVHHAARQYVMLPPLKNIVGDLIVQSSPHCFHSRA